MHPETKDIMCRVCRYRRKTHRKFIACGLGDEIVYVCADLKNTKWTWYGIWNFKMHMPFDRFTVVSVVGYVPQRSWDFRIREGEGDEICRAKVYLRQVMLLFRKTRYQFRSDLWNLLECTCILWSSCAALYQDFQNFIW